jgi:hypothetical protein
MLKYRIVFRENTKRNPAPCNAVPVIPLIGKMRNTNVYDSGKKKWCTCRYGLSYLESLLLVDMVQRQPATSDQPIDVDQLSAADILCHAK